MLFYGNYWQLLFIHILDTDDIGVGGSDVREMGHDYLSTESYLQEHNGFQKGRHVVTYNALPFLNWCKVLLNCKVFESMKDNCWQWKCQHLYHFQWSLLQCV